MSRTPTVRAVIAALTVVVLGLVSSCARDGSRGSARDKAEVGPQVELPAGAEAQEPGDGTRTSTTPHIVFRSSDAMGSRITITAYTTDEGRALSAFRAAFVEMERLEGILSIWRASSDVARLNASAGVAPVKIRPETLDVLGRALEGSKLTHGKFDVTFGALAGLWKFDHDQDGSVPARREVLARLRLVGADHLHLDREAETAYLDRAGMRVHLGGIGKGYAVDRAVAILRAHGLRDFMVQFGGDMFVAGRRGERPWRVGIRDPRGPPESYFAATEVTDATFSTSGDYERAFFKDGRRYHHIIDLSTGEPATACRSVTIMAPDATTAEILSKGVFVLGPERGLRIVEATPGAGAVIVDRHNKVHVSMRLEGRVKLLASPTDAL